MCMKKQTRLWFLLIAMHATLWCLPQSKSTGMNTALISLLQERNAPGFTCDLLVQGHMHLLNNHEASYGYTVNYFYGDIASIHCNINTVPLLLQAGIISYAEYIPAHKQLLNDTMVYRNRIKPVKVWTSPLPQAYNGEGILMGLIDSGLDFKHGDFKDSLGKTRVLYLWDQNPASGSAVPQPYNYGIEWTKNQMDNNQCSHLDLAYYGHGTHVTGIAAGNGKASGRYEGIAAKSPIIMVALNFNKAGPTTADALHYIFTKAAALNLPCVVNASVGDYYGSHDATDLEAKLIENMLRNQPGRAMVAAIGNAGYVKYHVKTHPAAGDTAFTWFENNGSHYYWCYADTAQAKNFRVAFGVNSPNFNNISRTPFRNYNYALGTLKRDTLRNAAHQRIGILETSASINNYGVYELFVKINSDSSNVFWRVETTGSGSHHAWNFDFKSTTLPGTAQHPRMSKYAMPDTMYSMVSSFQCSEEVITVGNYVNMYGFVDVNNTYQPSGQKAGEIAFSSSSGPTRDGRTKPDIAAGGQYILSAMPAGLKTVLFNNSPYQLAPDTVHVIGGGSSAASPIVAGLAALYMQRHPSATNQQLRDAIRFCAYKDYYTGSNLPDYRWGFGKLDGKASMTCNETGVAVGIDAHEKNQITLFPNPFSEMLSVQKIPIETGEAAVYDLSGKCIYKTTFSGGRFDLPGSQIETNTCGLLLIRFSNGTSTFTTKAILERNQH